MTQADDDVIFDEDDPNRILEVDGVDDYEKDMLESHRGYFELSSHTKINRNGVATEEGID